MFDLPEDNPFSNPVRMLLWLSILKTFCIICLIAAAFRLTYRLTRAEERQERVLLLAENYAKLGSDRRTDAKHVAEETKATVTITAEETKSTILKGMEEIKKVVPETVSDKVIEKLGGSTTELLKPKDPNAPIDPESIL